jgi:hypothetical protein
LEGISSRAFNEARAALIIGSVDTTLSLKRSSAPALICSGPALPTLQLIEHKAGNVAFAEV